MNKYLIIFSAAISYAVIASTGAGAQQISYPVSELGGCGNETDCRSFCDDESHMVVCVNFAEKNGLMSAEDAAQARKFAKIGAGPGGCQNQKECQLYCDDVGHIDACLDFASKNGFIGAAELAEAQKVAQALKSGASLPGGCKNKKECESYCDDLSNVGECFDFAEKAGFIPPDEIDDARKAVAAMKQGARPPGGCKNKKECDSYCSDPNNIEACFDFAEEAGFIPPEEIEQARKVIPMMKAGKMPGGCKNKNDCESYCQDDSHMEECANFALEAGFMKPEEVEMFKKTGGKGPGGCKGKERCESFCNDPAHQEECFNFASEKGLIPEDQVKQMKEGMAQFRQGLDMATPEVLECIKSKVGVERFEKMKSGGLPDRSVGEAMGSCFSQMMKPPAGFEGKGGPPSAEDIQKMLPKGVEVTPEMMQKGPPSQADIQSIIQKKVQEEMQKRGAPPGGSFGPPAGTNFGPPAGAKFGPPSEIPSGPPAGFGPPPGL